jgi:hypothetical protein
LWIKLFHWMIIDNRILNWDNFLKRGFAGTSRCFMCGEAEETINYLILNFPFTREDSFYLLKVLKVQIILDCGKLSESFHNWNKVKDNWMYLLLD